MTNNGFLINSSIIQTNNTDVTLNNQSYTGFTFNGNCIIDSICIQNYGKSDTEVLNTSVSTLPDWTPSVIFLSSMNNSVEGSNITGLIDSPTSWSLYRKEVNGNELFKVCEVEPDVLSYIDYKCESNKTYEWYLFANSNTQVSSPIVTDKFTTNFYGYYLIDSVDVDDYTNNNSVESYMFDLNLSSDKVTNDNSMVRLQNFTKFDAIVIQNRNVRTGSFSSMLIPKVNGEYDFEGISNFNDMLQGLKDFLHNQKSKYLKTRSGNILKVITEGNSSTFDYQYNDSIGVQPVTVTIYWTEVAETYTGDINTSATSSQNNSSTYDSGNFGNVSNTTDIFDGGDF
jgi:hypothetical protein